MPSYSLQIEIVFNPHFWPLYFLLRKHIIFTVSFKDYAGEFFHEMAHEKQRQPHIKEYLDSCALSSRMMILIDSLVSSEKHDLEYALAIKNLGQELDMRLKKGSRNLNNYRIAVVLTKFDQLQVWKYRNEPREFFQRQFPRTYKSLRQLMNNEKCLISYFSCSAFGMKGEPPQPNAIGYGNSMYFVLQDTELWQPFGLIAPIYWLCTGQMPNKLREF